ncbi:hypothetical protein LTR84_007045 [Exophiala bonariae]|uniref:magnesium chelatase n=1 Tax=Exophiala bonariae TaxID=1690606 RepID=A0AAV9MZT5_9EURO|nr:hypothetical protein LTR84_007045 [Exophiala bonariae]
MDDQALLERIEDLTDLELAVLLSLIAQQHCIIETREDALDDLAAELALIVSQVFKLNYVVLEREDLDSVARFGELILNRDISEPGISSNTSESDYNTGGTLHSKLAGINFRQSSSVSPSRQDLDSRKIVNVIIAKEFNLAKEDVQIQTLEIIRKRRHIRLTKHLNDRIFMSHHHEVEDGFLNLEELDSHSEDHGSSYSIGAPPSVRYREAIADRVIDQDTIELLRARGQEATITPEIRRYLQDIVVFLRIERGVDGGVSPYATTLLLALSKYLAPFHGIDYVTPSLVALAAKKIYPHRVVMASPSRERSTQYGTDMASAREILSDLDPVKVIQNVLDTVECPT